MTSAGMRARLGLGAALLLLVAPALRAAPDDAVALREALNALEPQADGARRAPALRRALQQLERRAAAARLQFEVAAGKPLPPKAAERLARARAAHVRGQQRLLGLLRELLAGQDQEGALASEARALLGRLEESSRPEPISSAPRLRAPELRPGPLPEAVAAIAEAVEPPPIGYIHPALKALAESLPGPIEVYAWVRNNVRTEFYQGVMKGALQTYLEGGGNDADTAALLVTLLRAKGIPARYVQGTVELDRDSLVRVTGTTNAERAVRVLERAGIPHEPVVGSAGVLGARLARVWAEAYLPYANYRGLSLDAHGKLWVPLDAAYKSLAAPSGFEVLIPPLSVEQLGDQYLSSLHAETPRAFVHDTVAAALAERGHSYEQAVNNRALEAEELGLLPNRLPYKVVARGAVGFEPPEALAHGLRVSAELQGQALFDVSLPLTRVLGQRLTLAYEPFDEDDAATVRLYGGIPSTPPYLIEVRPLLKSGGVVVAAGQVPVGSAVRYDLHVELQTPGGSERFTNRVLAGNLLAIGLGGRQPSGAEPQGAHAAALLARIGFDYLRRWNESDEQLADLARVVPVRPMASACLVAGDIDVEYADGDPLYPLSFDWKGVLIDADLRASAPVGIADADQERRFLMLSGLEGSALEHVVFQEAWNVESVSTAKALQLAGQAGTPVLTVDRDNVEDVLPGLPFDASVKQEIREAALRGLVVRVPSDFVTRQAWSGVGYRILDDETGDSAWQLQGGHSGGVTAPARIDWPDELAETLVDQGEEAAPVGTPVARLIKFISTDFQKGIVNKPLDRPLRVVAVDENGQRVPGAYVTFSVIGGGGTLLDPFTGASAEGSLTVTASLRGEAEVTLVQGKSTAEIPRYLCENEDVQPCSEENDKYATQVGLNMVGASAGEAQLDTPFLSYAKPDDQFDGTYRYAFISVRSGWHPGGILARQLRVATLLAINVVDPYENPISNFGIRVAYKPPPDATPPAGWVTARPATNGPQTEAHILKPRDYVPCQNVEPIVRWGECAGEAVVVVQPSGSAGSFFYPVMGDSPYSLYSFDVGTDVEHEVLPYWWGTFGVICYGSCSGYAELPIVWVQDHTRPQLVNRLGNMIEAYAPSTTAWMQFGAEVLFEDYELSVTTDQDGNPHYKAKGINSWHREALTDSVFTLSPKTPGTGASPGEAVHVGAGRFVSDMRLAAAPQLNTVGFAAKHFPEQIPYLPDDPLEVDPAYVDATTLTVQKIKRFDKPFLGQGEMSLWGAAAAITSLVPTPIRVDRNRVVVSSQIAYQVQPAAFRSALDTTDQWFTLKRGETDVLAASASADGSPFQVPAGLPFAAGDYSGLVSIPGVSVVNQDFNQRASIVSPPFPIPACAPLSLETPQVVLPIVSGPPPETSCVTADRIIFSLCAKARVTLTVAGEPLRAPVDGVELLIQNLLLEAGTHVVNVPPELLDELEVESAPFLVRAVTEEEPILTREEPGVIQRSPRFLTLETPHIRLKRTVDPVNGTECSSSEPMKFDVCLAAKVTIKVDGDVLEASLDGGPLTPLQDIQVGPGQHVVSVPAQLLGLDEQQPFTIHAVALSDDELQQTVEGTILSSLLNRTVLPVGHTFVKGVDVFDGHVVAHEVDFSLPGRHLGLEMSRTYASSSQEPEGPLGPGWNFLYGLTINVSSCGVVLNTRDSTQLFTSSDGGQSFSPQRGYHGRLVKNADGTYDYYDKADVQHHFSAITLPEVDRGRIEYLREPHGDRLVMTYDGGGRLNKVVEEQSDEDVRELRLTWGRAGGFDRIVRAEAFAGATDLRVGVDYAHDEQWGNLEQVTRTGANVAGRTAEDRVHKYRYSKDDTRDRHQLVQVTDPNGHETDYQYWRKDELLPGEDGQTFFVTDKEERVKRVTEHDPRALATEFTYDLRDALLLQRWKTEVKDAVQRPILYVMDGYGGTLEVHEPLDKLTQMTWNGEGRKESETDANLRRTDFGYDGKGNLTSEIVHTSDPELGDVSSGGSWDQTFGKPLSKTDRKGASTTWQLNALNGDVTLMRDAGGNETLYEYDGGSPDGPGLLTKTTDARGHATLHQDHNDYGQPRRVRDPLGNETRRTYDARGRLETEEDDLGHRTVYEYDGLDRVVRVQRVAGFGSQDEIIGKDYYPGGQLRSELNAKGATTTYGLDGLNRVTDKLISFDRGSIQTRVRYDLAGNKETETDARGVRRRFFYDDLDRLKRVAIESGPAPGPTGDEATFEYDLVGNKLWETNIAGLRTDFDLDGLYRVKARRLPEDMPSGYSPAGRLTEQYAYDGVGNRTSLVDANGRETIWQYDGLDRVTRTSRGTQFTNTRYCNAFGDPPTLSGLNKCEETNERGLHTLFDYDELNREKTRTVRLEGPDGDPAIDQYVTATDYDDGAHSLTATDPRDKQTLTRLNGLDRPYEQTVDVDGEALVTKTFYDGLGGKTLVLDPRGFRTSYVYDTLGRLVTVLDAYLKPTAYDYDDGGLKIFESDRRNVVRRFEYDNLERQTRAYLDGTPYSDQGWSKTTVHDDVGRRRTETDARGKATVFRLDKLGRVVQETDPDDKSAFSVWDGVNRVQRTDKRPAHNVTRFQYDALDRLTVTQDPAPWSFTLTTTYLDSQNQVVESDRRNTQKVMQLDSLGRLRQVTRAGIVLERHRYDGIGNKLSSEDALGHGTAFDYDGANRLVKRTDAPGTPVEGVTTFLPDPNGNVLEEQDPRARALGRPYSVKRVFDRLNRTTDVYDGEGNHAFYGYDAEGNRQLVRAPKLQETTFGYDELGKPLKVIQPGNRTTEYRYDQNRNLRFVTDANIHTVERTYDDLNRLQTLRQPGGLVSTLGYDEDGRETLRQEPSGQSRNSTYDELGRLATRSYTLGPGAPPTWRRITSVVYGYDENGHQTQSDESVAGGNALTTRRHYDALDRLEWEEAELPDNEGLSRRVLFGYYENGLRRSVDVVEQPGDDDLGLTEYTYDARNRLETATSHAGTPGASTSTYAYHPDSLLREVTYPNGVKATHQYDKADRLVSLVNAKGGQVVSSYAYGYDKNGNRETQTEVNGGSPEITSYTYDDLNRLKTVNYPGKRVEYGYDDVGNRVSEIEKDLLGNVTSSKTAGFDANNRLTSISDPVQPGNDAGFTYDDNGNLLSKTQASGVSTYVYDARDKLVEARLGAVTTGRFQYDCDGRRTLKMGDPTGAGDSGTRQFVYDGESVLLETDAAGLPTARYEWGSERLVSLFRANEPRRFFSFDGLRSVVSLTSDAGAAVANYHLDAWGGFRDPSELDDSNNRVAFTGHYYDAETKLYFANARYFDPQFGRFLTQDANLGELSDPPSLHRYVYASDRPTYLVDPDGRESLRQNWGLDKPDSFWSAFGKNLAYNTWNAISFGTLGRQDTLVEKYEAGQISEGEYWGKTAINAGSGLAIAGATAATGGLAGGIAEGLGAGATVAGAVSGVAGGLAGQGTSDLIEVFGTETKTAAQVRPLDYLIAGGTGGLLGGIGGAASANPGSVRFNLDPDIPWLGALDDTFVQKGARAGLQALEETSAFSRDVGFEGALAGRRFAGTAPEAVNPGIGSGDAMGILQDAATRVQLGRLHRAALREVDAAIAAGDANAVASLGARGGEVGMALAGDPRIRGTLIDLAWKQRIAQSSVGAKVGVTPTRRGPGVSNYGVDVWSLRSLRSWDSTTVRGWPGHIPKYVTAPPAGRPVWRSISPLLTEPQAPIGLWGLPGVAAAAGNEDEDPPE